MCYFNYNSSKKLSCFFLFLTFLLLLPIANTISQQKSEDERISNMAREYYQQNIIQQTGSSGGDNPEAIQERFFTGQAAGDQFGYSVASAGDVNGDGYDDIIVGAPYYDGSNTNCGRAYIFWGGQMIDYIPDVILKGEQGLNHYFGTSVAGAGDLNGDGYDDIVVGAPGTDYRGTDAGTFYIYLGGNPMSLTHHQYLDGSYAGDQLGISVNSAGDVNGDGYSDLIVGAFLNDANSNTDAGIAYIFYGGTTVNVVADVTLTGAAANDYFGYSVASAGDVNGDGYSDVIVGAYGNDNSGADAGRAYVYFGGSPMNNTADVFLNGASAGDYFGYSVSTAGDVNGDGFVDVVVGAWLNDYSGSNTGRAYIYLGGSTMNSAVDVYLNGSSAGDGFGRSVSTTGDINGDGYSDVVVGSIWNDAGGFDAGRAYIYFGGAIVNNSADVILTGKATDNFGVSCSAAGDVNGDGYSDVIVGANGNDAGGDDAGRAYVYTNSLTGTDIPDEYFTGAFADDRFGQSVSSAGDVNGDGYPDLIIGAYQNDAGGWNVGQAYIYFGGPMMDFIADITLTGANDGDEFGSSVSTAGDVNGDGYSDVIVGAYKNGPDNTGSAYIYFGGSAMNNTVDVTLTGTFPDDFLGRSVSSAGDVNSDGYSDVIVGAYYCDGRGKAYIYFGGTSMDITADVTLTGAAVGDFFGYSVSTAGDVNNDGYSDVIVGAYGNDAGGIDAGRAYIYFGGAIMNNNSDVILTGAAATDLFGYSVSTAGDVNGDGYSDVIVGAWANDASGSNTGSAYIYFGGTSMDNAADVTLTGAEVDDRFGTSVFTAEDINGDGYSDVIVGANGNNAGGVDAGRAYIYFSGASMDNTSDVILTGAAANDNFGYSVSTAGDMNNDGYSDVIIGAYDNDAGGNNAGRAYLYLSSSPPVKPRIMSVKDVPGDQGGSVFVNFVRSSYDAVGINNKITEYRIEISNPPGVGGFSWSNIGSVSPNSNPLYTFIASTPYDSSTNLSGTFFYRITARTSNNNEFWRSNIMSGHSVDNLSPTGVIGFAASAIANDNKLSWKANTESDLKDYYIYRSFTSTIDPDVVEPIIITGDTTELDSSVPPGDMYYFIRARDIHDNFGPLTQIASPLPLRQINFTALIEGFYDSGTNLMVEDTVDVLLKNTTAPYSTIDQSKVKLNTSGKGLVKFRQAANSTNYYLVFKHRNSIETWSKLGQQFTNSEMTFDFTTASTKAFGDNMKLKGGKWTIFSGDVNQDGVIDALDRSASWNDRNLAGYLSTDVNGDNVVDALDRSICWNNRNITTKWPGGPPLAKPTLKEEVIEEDEEKDY